MMEYGKLTDGNLEILKLPIRTAEEHIFTNDPAMILEHGYKPIMYTEQEEREGFYCTGFEWTETEAEIVQEWIYEEINYEQN